MKTMVLVIGVIKKGNKILLRKKPDGSPPYKQTWYLFGAEVNAQNSDPEKALQKIVLAQTGIKIKTTKRLDWDTETKPDLTGEMTYHIYLDLLCEFVSGKLTPGTGIEKLEWVPKSKLLKYDLVPPSIKLFKRWKYI